MTSPSDYTPGPWSIRHAMADQVPTLLIDALEANTTCLAGIYGMHESKGININANARLIAAAPDLLEACKRAFDWFHNKVGMESIIEDQILLAIMKATIDSP